MTTWLSDPSANRHIKTYVKDFLDLSGNMVVRQDGYTDYKWNSYGQVLSGPYENEASASVYFGLSVGMDVSGLTIVVGSVRQNGNNLANSGAVYVYRYDTTAELWYQLGNLLAGDSSNHDFGWNVDINDAGTRIMATAALGEYVNVYDYNSGTNTWDKQVSIAHTISAYAGRISGDGNTIVFGDYANNSNRGIQYVYRNTSGTTWTKIGEFTGSHSEAYGSLSPSLSYDGNRVTVTERDYNYDANGNTVYNLGRGAIYDYSGSGTTWNQVGDWIYGDSNYSDNRFGASEDLSKDGSIVAFSAQDGYYVKVYQYDAAVTGSWRQLGSTIDGSVYNFGTGVRLSDDGTTLLISDRSDGTAGSNNGALYIYKYNGYDWAQQGSTLYGAYTGAQIGFHLNPGVSISGDGSKIVFGGIYADVNGTDSGYVQAFQWSREPTGGIFMDISGGLTIDCHSNDNLTKDTFAQLGSTLTGSNDGLGYSIAMNYTGDTMVASQHGANSNKGQLLLYKYRSGSWNLIATLNGTDSDRDRYLGIPVDINNDGSVIATSSHSSEISNVAEMGSIRVYEYTTGAFVQKGSDIDGNNGAGDYFGARGLVLSGDGTVVAGTSWGGYAKVFKYVEDSTNDWVQMGSDFTVTNVTLYISLASRPISLDDSGTVVAIASPDDDTTGTNNGKVEVYKFTGDVDTGSWNQLGSTIYGVEGAVEGGRDIDSREGATLKLSADGTILATGTYAYKDYYGLIRVFKYIEAAGDWCQMGVDIQHDAAENFARGFDMSSDGKTLAVGVNNADEGYNNAGGTEIFKYINGQWVSVDHIASTYTTTDTLLGKNVTISGDGKRFAAGSDTNPGIIEAWEIINHNQPALKVKHGRAILGGNLTVNKNVGIGTSIPSTTLDVWGYNLNSNTVDYLVNPITYSTSSTEVQEGIGTGITFDVERAKDSFYPTGTFTGYGCAAIRLWGSRNIPGYSDQWSMSLITREADSMRYNLTIRYDGNIGINQTDPGSRGYVSGSGRSTAQSSSSDDRVKVNEQKIEGALTTLQKLVPQTYTKYEHFDISGNKTTTDLSSNSVFEAGLIAQEIYYNAPELRHLVTAGDDASANNFHPQEYDLSGNDIQHDPDYTALGWGTQPVIVNYTQLIPYLIKAIQEEQDMIASQKTRIEDITSRVTALKNK